MSRLPLKNPKTFDNFDFSVMKGRDATRLKTLPSLSAIYAHKNLAFIGPAGTGKTHLAQAFGYECCQRGIKTYFIKISSCSAFDLCAVHEYTFVVNFVLILQQLDILVEQIFYCFAASACPKPGKGRMIRGLSIFQEAT